MYLSTEMLVDEQIDTVLRTRESLLNQKAALKAIHSQMTTLASELFCLSQLKKLTARFQIASQ